MKYPLFDLTPEKFVELCTDLFNSENSYDDICIFSNNDGKSTDIQAYKGIEKTGFEVKHKFTFSKKSLIDQLEKSKEKILYFQKFILIVSAKIPKKIKLNFTSAKLKIYDQEDLFELLDKHTYIADRYFKNLKKEKKKKLIVFLSLIVGIMVSITLTSISIFPFFNNNEDKLLENKIQNVEEVLKTIKNLEGDLNKIKEDMVITEIQNKKIILEYVKLKGVEDLIGKQTQRRT